MRFPLAQHRSTAKKKMGWGTMRNMGCLENMSFFVSILYYYFFSFPHHRNFPATFFISTLYPFLTSLRITAHFIHHSSTSPACLLETCLISISCALHTFMTPSFSSEPEFASRPFFVWPFCLPMIHRCIFFCVRNYFRRHSLSIKMSAAIFSSIPTSKSEIRSKYNQVSLFLVFSIFILIFSPQALMLRKTWITDARTPKVWCPLLCHLAPNSKSMHFFQTKLLNKQFFQCNFDFDFYQFLKEIIEVHRERYAEGGF